MLKIKLDENNIVILTIDCETKPMNVIDKEFVELFHQKIEEITSDEKNQGLILTSARDEFVAGGDLEMLRSINTAEDCVKVTSLLHKALRKIETWGKPAVAALTGTTLGGGYELALGCHHRICINKPKAKIGLPEVTLGLLPGGGGTQRLPRMIGLQSSILYLTTGKQLNPEKALKAGLINDLVDSEDELIQKSVDFIKSNPEIKQPWDEKKFKLPGGEVQSPKGYQIIPASTAMMNEKTHGNYLAPKNILCAVYEGCQVPIDQALEIELRYFTELVLNPSTKNMIRTLFYGINECNKGQARPKDAPKKAINKVGILGAGMMGSGIAFSTAMAGIPCVMKDISEETLERGKAYSSNVLDKMIERGRCTPEKKEKVLSLISTTTEPKEMEGCDLVIEAVIEDRALKARVTKESEDVMPSDGIFASNTSTLPITGLAKESQRPKQFIGLHFFSPVDKMPLVEIIMGEETGDEALAMCVDYVRAIKKTPIVVNDGRGFYTSRVFTTYVSEGINLVTEGVNPALIENAGKMCGMPVGPLAVADEVSIDLIYHIVKQTVEDVGLDAVDKKTLELSTKFVEELGRLGRKAGKGFYEYPESGKKHISPELEKLYPISKEQPSLEEVKDRLLYIQSIETLRCLEENILTTSRDADVGSIMGWGFPAWAGGSIGFVELTGVKNFKERCLELEKLYGKRFSPPSILDKKESFYS
ncbi:MAG: enoyl-CoA hydratase/isomerase family protein [Bacteriovoracaceae bacterium]|nr:enoyl-CoA hydratase/isomerase family protein [Bacteriovoracaceae bacterium]